MSIFSFSLRDGKPGILALDCSRSFRQSCLIGTEESARAGPGNVKIQRIRASEKKTNIDGFRAVVSVGRVVFDEGACWIANGSRAASPAKQHEH